MRDTLYVKNIRESRAEEERNEFEKIILERDTLRKNDYDELLTIFNEPKKVQSFNNGYLLLSDGNVIKSVGADGINNYYLDIISYEKEVVNNVIKPDKEVYIMLPDYGDFQLYSHGYHSVFGFDGTNSKYGDIPAFVFLDGQSLNLKYALHDKEFYQRYQDKFDSLNMT